MKSNERTLKELVDELIGQENKIVKDLGKMILSLGLIQTMEGNKTYDLAFKSLNKRYKPSFATFITYTHKEHGVWNTNTVPDSVVVQVRFKGITDPDRIKNPKKLEIWSNDIEQKRGWFKFRVGDAKRDSIQNAFQMVKQAFDSFD